jgi:hypothetical protein
MSEAARAVTWRHGTALMEAMWIIVVADVVMRLDNALAAVAHGHLILVVLGIAWSARLPFPSRSASALPHWAGGTCSLKEPPKVGRFARVADPAPRPS